MELILSDSGLLQFRLNSTILNLNLVNAPN